jgi:phage shock protein A
VARQQVVIARYNAAEAQVQIKEAVTGVSREFAELTSALAQAEERTEGMEARVSAIDRLVREGLLDPGPLSSPESAPMDDVEDQLAVLEREIGR